MPKDKTILKHITKEIKDAKTIALFGHISPDIDCFGSMFGMYYGLTSIGKKVQIFSYEKLKFDQASLFNEKLVQIGDFQPNNFDLVISLDVATKDRLGEYKESFCSHPHSIKIDHHKVGNNYAKINYIEYDKSSCSEIVFNLFKFMHLNISPEIATALYAGLSSDTYSFVNANTNISSFETGKLLFEKGADIRKANVTLYQTLTKPQFEMKKYLYKNLEIIDDEIAIITIPYKDMVEVGACKQDCENHSSEMASIQGVNISCSIIERQPNKINCSFRSRDGYNVSLIAQRLGGGGHVHAAGCRLEIENLKEARDLVLDAIRKYLKSREN